MEEEKLIYCWPVFFVSCVCDNMLRSRSSVRYYAFLLLVLLMYILVYEVCREFVCSFVEIQLPGLLVF